MKVGANVGAKVGFTVGETDFFGVGPCVGSSVGKADG